MIFILMLIFFISTGLLIYSYLLYPFLVKLLATNKKNNTIIYTSEESLPSVFVCIAAYNEEKVIGEKLQTLFDQDYPADKVQYLVGSDCSTDGTNEILSTFHEKRSDFKYLLFEQRTGKPGVINQLVATCKEMCKEQGIDFRDQILLFTDANVLLEKRTLLHLVKHFKNKKIDLVDGHLKNSNFDASGISHSEMTYIGREVQLKHNEGKVWQCLMGTFGACFALRASAYHKVPANFVVDDFYLTLKVLESKKGVISELEATCTEAFPEDIKEEFRRKVRISSGNFQNLSAFKHLLNPFTKLGFVFTSHKAIRYIGPFLMIGSTLSAILLLTLGIEWMKIVVLAILIWYILIPAFDYLLDKTSNFDTGILRSIRYFNLMNCALLLGYNKYRNGIKSNAWEPTKRN